MITFKECIEAYFACKEDKFKPCYSCPCNQNKIPGYDGICDSFCDILCELDRYFEEDNNGE